MEVDALDLRSGAHVDWRRVGELDAVWIDVRSGPWLSDTLEFLRPIYGIPSEQIDDILRTPMDIFPRIDHTGNLYCRLRCMYSVELRHGHACFILFPNAVISVFSEDLDLVRASVRPGATTGMTFVRLVEAMVLAVAPVLTVFDAQISVLEQRTFNADRPDSTADIEQCMVLHGLKRMLGGVRQSCTLTHRCIETTVQHMRTEHACDTERAVDAFEEVMNVSHTLISRIDGMCAAAQDLDQLMFNLSAYRSSKMQQVLAGVSVLFVPLTWWAGIYGTNFEIFPELTWGADEDVQPAGWPAGYMYFWLTMGALAVASVAILRGTSVF